MLCDQLRVEHMLINLIIDEKWNLEGWMFVKRARNRPIIPQWRGLADMI